MSNSRLPPNVDGCVRGHLRLHVPFIIWLNYEEKTPDDVFQVHVSFWGQHSIVILSPVSTRSKVGLLADSRTLMKYDVCCSLKRFHHYLNDMNFLDLFVYHDGDVLGSCRVGQLQFLDLRTPIAGLYPIMNHDMSLKLGELFVSLSLTSCRSCRHSNYRRSDCQCNDQSGSDSSQNSYPRRPDYRDNLFVDQLSLKKSLNNLLKRAISLRSKGYSSILSERMPARTNDVKWNLGEFVSQVFRDDSSPDESLLEAVFFQSAPKKSSLKTKYNEYERTNRRSREHYAPLFNGCAQEDDSPINQDSHNLGHLSNAKEQEIILSRINRIKDVESISVQDRSSFEASSHIISTLKPSSSKSSVSKASVDSFTDVKLILPVNRSVDTSNESSLQSENNKQKPVKSKIFKTGLTKASVAIKKKEDTVQTMKSDNSQNNSHGLISTSINEKLQNSDEKDLRVMIASLQLNDCGLNLLGKSRRDWSFRLEIRMPVLKGIGLGVWDYRGHRVTSDLQVTQFISCIFNRGLVSFNQEKEFVNVDRSQSMLIRLEAKNSVTQQRRSLGSCTLQLKDISDAKIILPVSTVQPNGQLSLNITALRLSSSRKALVERHEHELADVSSEHQSNKRVNFSITHDYTLKSQDHKTRPISLKSKRTLSKEPDKFALSDSSVQNQASVQFHPNPDENITKISDRSLPSLPDFESHSEHDRFLDGDDEKRFYRGLTSTDKIDVIMKVGDGITEGNDDQLFRASYQELIDYGIDKLDMIQEDVDMIKDQEKLEGNDMVQEDLDMIKDKECDILEKPSEKVVKKKDVLVKDMKLLPAVKTTADVSNNVPVNDLENLKSLHNTGWTICIEKAVNLPLSISNTFVTCDCDNIIIKTNISVNHLWNYCQDVILDPYLSKGLHLKLFKCVEKHTTSDNTDSGPHMRLDCLIGECTVDIRSLHWLSFLSGWYLLKDKDKVVGQIKISVWPRKRLLLMKEQENPGLSKLCLNEKTWINLREEVEDLTKTLESLQTTKRPSRRPSVVENLKRSLGKNSISK